MKVNHEKRNECVAALEEAKVTIGDALQKVRGLLNPHPSYSNWDAYVFRQLDEHVENANPYNQSLDSIIVELEGDEEVVQEWDEEEWGEGDD